MDFGPKHTTPPTQGIGSVDGVTPAAAPNDGSKKTYTSRGEWAQAMRQQTAETAGTAAEEAAGDASRTPEPSSGLNHEDPWDRGEINQPEPDADAMARYRRRDGYALETPVNGPALDQDVVADFGSVAKHVGLSQDAAQALVTTMAGAGTKEREALDYGGGEYDPQRTVSELRFEFGAELEPALARIEQFCATRPALAAYLDSTGLGNSPEVLRLLAGASLVGTTPDAARSFIAKVNGDASHLYWQGDKLALAAVRFAYALTGE